jgi:NAD(P)-dependent dehydrogenase (short-subunit alcohol dehydrogenase family)
LEFEGKVVLITGACGAIGREATRRFLEEGALVVLVDHDQEKLKRLEHEYRYETEDVLCLYGDARNEQEVAAYIKRAADIFDEIDMLVHCVGMTGAVGQPSMLSKEDFMDFYETNVVTAFLNYKYVLPVMQKKQKGSILFLSSFLAHRSVPFFSTYSVAYGALSALMKAATADCAPMGIRVNSICMAPVESPLMDQIEKVVSAEHPPFARQQFLNFIPFNRYVKVEEVVDHILFLSSDRASYINGAEHFIDSGLSTIL